jgi:hypothetical protein
LRRLRHALGRVFQLLLAVVYTDRDVLSLERFGMRVLCVDPTPRAISHVAGLLDAAATGRPYAVEGGAERANFVFVRRAAMAEPA